MCTLRISSKKKSNKKNILIILKFSYKNSNTRFRHKSSHMLELSQNFLKEFRLMMQMSKNILFQLTIMMGPLLRMLDWIEANTTDG